MTVPLTPEDLEPVIRAIAEAGELDQLEPQIVFPFMVLDSETWTDDERRRGPKADDVAPADAVRRNDAGAWVRWSTHPDVEYRVRLLRAAVRRGYISIKGANGDE